MNKAPSIFVVRHGHTAFNASTNVEDRIRGWIDVPLDEQGEQEAVEAANKLKDQGVDHIYSSDLTRARTTAQTISDITGAPVVLDSFVFRPWNLGEYQGQETKVVLPMIHELIKDPDEPAPDGESLNDFTERYLDSLKVLMEEVEESGKTIVLVTHYRNLELTKAWFGGDLNQLNINFKDLISGKDFDTGEIMQLKLEDGKWNYDQSENL